MKARDWCVRVALVLVAIWVCLMGFDIVRYWRMAQSEEKADVPVVADTAVVVEETDVPVVSDTGAVVERFDVEAVPVFPMIDGTYGKIWVPFLPPQISEKFPLRSERDNYGIWSIENHAERVFKSRGIIAPGEKRTIVLAGGQWACVSLVQEDELKDGCFDPLQWGFLIRYDRKYLYITFPEREVMEVRDLSRN